MCRCEDAVTGDEDRNGIVAIGLADRPGAAAGHSRNVEIGLGRSVRNRAQRLPHSLLIEASGRSERQIELGQLLVEVLVQLVAGTPQQSRFALTTTPAPID